MSLSSAHRLRKYRWSPAPAAGLELLLAVSLLAAATPAVGFGQAERVVILVRHAERAAEPGADPPLTEAGRARAQALAAALREARLDAAIVSQFRRTLQTAEPAAAAQGITPLVVRASGDPAAHVRAVADAVLAQPGGATVLVVGHSNTIPGILAALGGPRLPDLCDAEHATLFVLALPENGPPRLIRAQYGAPDPPGAALCR